MAKYTKEIKTIKIDYDDLYVDARCARCASIDSRLVMSTRTRDAMRADYASTVRSSFGMNRTCDTFAGLPIDLNDALDFGEVLFTRPV